jgi:hypothetical protein
MPTLDEWITKYEQEAEELIILPGFQCHYEPDKGFFYWKVSPNTIKIQLAYSCMYINFGNVFEVDHTCTNDIAHMFQVANDMAKQRGCTVMLTATKRDPASYMRLTRAKINLTYSGIRPNGNMYWCFEKEVI